MLDRTVADINFPVEVFREIVVVSICPVVVSSSTVVASSCPAVVSNEPAVLANALVVDFVCSVVVSNEAIVVPNISEVSVLKLVNSELVESAVEDDEDIDCQSDVDEEVGVVVAFVTTAGLVGSNVIAVVDGLVWVAVVG